MTTLLFSIVIVGLLIAGMAIGVLMGREPIKGTCGGIGALGMDKGCEICGGDQTKCDTSTADKPSGVGIFQP